MIWTSIVGRDSLKSHQMLSRGNPTAFELYDLARDTREQDDIYGQSPGPLDKLGRVLGGMQKRHFRRRQNLDATVPRGRNPDLAETLKALGYGGH